MSQRNKTELQRMKRDHLLTLAQSEGVEVGDDATKADVIDAMQSAGLVNNTEASGVSATASAGDSGVNPEEGVKKVYRRSPFSHQQHYYVIVHSTDDEDGARPVDVSVNGYPYRIPRDKEVLVPEAVVEVLQNAVETRLDEVGRDPQTGAPQFDERKSRRFAFGHRPA